MDIVYKNSTDNYRLLGIRFAYWLTCIYDAFVLAFICAVYDTASLFMSF